MIFAAPAISSTTATVFPPTIARENFVPLSLSFLAAPVARLERNAAYAIGPDVSRAVADYMDYAERKKAGKAGDFDEYVRQEHLFDKPSFIARELLKLFGTGQSPAAMAEYVRLYADAALGTDPAGDLLGAARTREEIWRDAATVAKENIEEGKVRYAISAGDDLAERDRFNAFVEAISIANPIPPGIELLPHDVNPKDALEYYNKHILGKTFTFPDGSTITMNPGHFFRLTCEGRQNKENIRKGFIQGYGSSAEALAAIAEGKVEKDDIYGWQSDRAGMIPIFGDIVEHPTVILEDKKDANRTQNIKRYEVGDGRSVVAIFRVLDNGKRIISFSGFTPKYNRLKEYRVIHVDDAINTGTSPARLADGNNSAQATNIIPYSGAESQYGRFAISGLYTGSAADYANRDERGNIVNGRQRFSVSITKPWPKDFPHATLMTTRAAIAAKHAGLFDKAKAGDAEAAADLVDALMSDKTRRAKILQLKKDHPDAAIACPVHAEEAGGRNKIPAAFAAYIANTLGMEVDDSIVQTVRAGHTGADAWYRLTHRAQFEGDIAPGKEYILVDDHITQGGTINELRSYIENNGGKVVAVAALTASRKSAIISPTKEIIDELKRRYPDIDQLLRDGDIAGSVEAITNSEAEYIKSFSPDAFRNRIAKARQERGDRLLEESLGASASNAQTPVKLVKTGGHWYAFGDDAERAASIVGGYLGSVGGEAAMSIDGYYFDSQLAKFIRNNIPVELYARNPDGSETKIREIDPGVRYSIGGLYTGSAADYDKPSLHYVGTGEGSQVYGWGLYGSTVRGVAEGYANEGRDTKEFFAWDVSQHGKKIDLSGGNSAEVMAAREIARTKGDVRRAVRDSADLVKRLKEGVSAGVIPGDTLKKQEAVLKKLKEGGWESRPGEARAILYEQTFFTDRAPGDESHLLKWYEPVGERERKLLDELGIASKTSTSGNFAGLTAYLKGTHVVGTRLENQGDFYNIVAEALGSPQAASEFLARAGIDGVKYPVGSYGKTVKDGNKAGWNYVSFRDDNIRVDHKWVDGQQRFAVTITPEVRKETTVATDGMTLEKATIALKQLSNTPLKNEETGISALIHSTQRRKILSAEAINKSKSNGFSVEDHSAAASIIDKLWKYAALGKSGPDKDGDVNIASIKRFVAPVRLDDRDAYAYITAKESVRDGHRVYSIELEKLETLESKLPPGVSADTLFLEAPLPRAVSDTSKMGEAQSASSSEDAYIIPYSGSESQAEKAKIDPETMGRAAIVNYAKSGADAAESALENYVAYFKLAHGSVPRSRTERVECCQCENVANCQIQCCQSTLRTSREAEERIFRFFDCLPAKSRRLDYEV